MEEDHGGGMQNIPNVDLYVVKLPAFAWKAYQSHQSVLINKAQLPFY